MAQNKIQDLAKLRRLILDLIDKEQWSSLPSYVKGGAGQYFCLPSSGSAEWLRSIDAAGRGRVVPSLAHCRHGAVRHHRGRFEAIRHLAKLVRTCACD